MVCCCAGVPTGSTSGVVDVLIATPGRLMAHLKSTPGATLDDLRYLVTINSPSPVLQCPLAPTWPRLDDLDDPRECLSANVIAKKGANSRMPVLVACFGQVLSGFDCAICCRW